ncbi:adenosylcobinamide-phosphate synthase CbiB [Methylovulum psychrotolerans]|uniref:Cobalamin biosynthesis protein CobD n=1 Tax=Methylovulum psychrotolerans TaxID=1704499 RepID=A0A1Z4BZC7_9GAMM|nr:adenosylcobinamide-phosphate synthase CbiB [Methylovulum psychrotolerans]ASF46628.1 cobalamin biosynthesis protein CobD [Methylovulum psychrotolerans]POZ51481.1 cobalamin biosynthesis protein CobD [Methylovulum psychrotolerans]
MFFALALLAYILDKVFGELPGKHPVMWMGDFIQAFERHFYRNSILSGGLLVLALVGLSLSLSLLAVYVCGLLPAWLALPVLALMASTGLAMNMLHASVAAILTADHPRQAIRLLVSRDTDSMDETAVYKAALETWAENLSDGVIAPLLYLLLFGLPGLAVYKAINTLDSMVAYKTERYLYFGRVAALADDAANYLPARLTALGLVLVSAQRRRAWQCALRDGNKLDSPNAGWPIAALAGALGVGLAGEAFYHGQLKPKPILGDALGPVTEATLRQGLQLRATIDGWLIALLVLGVLFS